MFERKWELLKLLSHYIRQNSNYNMKCDTKVYGNLELIVKICVLEEMRIAALISIKNLLF